MNADERGSDQIIVRSFRGGHRPPVQRGETIQIDNLSFV